MAHSMCPDCDCCLCNPARLRKMLVSIRLKVTKRLLVAEIITPFLGPTYVTKWIMRQIKALKLVEGDYEYQVGEKGAWSS